MGLFGGFLQLIRHSWRRAAMCEDQEEEAQRGPEQAQHDGGEIDRRLLVREQAQHDEDERSHRMATARSVFPAASSTSCARGVDVRHLARPAQ